MPFHTCAVILLQVEGNIFVKDIPNAAQNVLVGAFGHIVDYGASLVSPCIFKKDILQSGVNTFL